MPGPRRRSDRDVCTHALRSALAISVALCEETFGEMTPTVLRQAAKTGQEVARLIEELRVTPFPRDAAMS